MRGGLRRTDACVWCDGATAPITGSGIFERSVGRSTAGLFAVTLYAPDTSFQRESREWLVQRTTEMSELGRKRV